MSFSSEVREEVKKKCFTFKKGHSRITESCGEAYKQEFLMLNFIYFGSVSDPERFYHMEFVYDTAEEAEGVRKLISEFGIEAGIVDRKGRSVVYIKDSEAIFEMLGILGAHESMMKFENIRILKEMREDVQRKVNCETANLLKTVSASVRQTEDIQYIKEHKGLSKLPESLRVVAELRLERPQATLKELSEAMDPPVGKSGVNHRLRKLSLIADELRLKNRKEEEKQ
ncbi:MAG: DNA-binding protein WhiA [Eubacteriales bacterium]|nr:DNA-binding protein WhiA [Eubacteriales bacterium]